MSKLGVNIDHVATVRQARRGEDPDPIMAARVCEQAGAHSIVAHLREDRRHIQDRDLILLRKTVRTRLNLEMSIAADIVDFACDLHPHQVTVVPERRQEITTEGGLDVLRMSRRLRPCIDRLSRSGIIVSLFVAPQINQLKAAKDLGVNMVELHTGDYAHAFANRSYRPALKKLTASVDYCKRQGIVVNAGHGLNYENLDPLLGITGIEEYNIGHAIISRSVFVGLAQAVKEMLKVMA